MANSNEQVVSFLSLAMKSLTERMAMLLSLTMCFSLFCWALWAGTIIALVASAAFASLVFLPVLWRSSGGNKDG